MNSDQMQSLVRQALTFGGAVAVTAFHASPDSVSTYAGATAALVSILWSIFAHKAPA